MDQIPINYIHTDHEMLHRYSGEAFSILRNEFENVGEGYYGGDEVSQKSAQTLLIDIITATRLYNHVTVQDLERMWRQIRDDRLLTDFVMTCTSSFAMVVGSADQFKHLCKSLGFVFGMGPVNLQIDEDLSNGLADPHEMQTIFETNMWYVWLTLTSMRMRSEAALG